MDHNPEITFRAIEPFTYFSNIAQKYRFLIWISSELHFEDLTQQSRRFPELRLSHFRRSGFSESMFRCLRFILLLGSIFDLSRFIWLLALTCITE